MGCWLSSSTATMITVATTTRICQRKRVIVYAIEGCNSRAEMESQSRMRNPLCSRRGGRACTVALGSTRENYRGNGQDEEKRAQDDRHPEQHPLNPAARREHAAGVRTGQAPETRPFALQDYADDEPYGDYNQRDIQKPYHMNVPP